MININVHDTDIHNDIYDTRSIPFAMYVIVHDMNPQGTVMKMEINHNKDGPIVYKICCTL